MGKQQAAWSVCAFCQTYRMPSLQRGVTQMYMQKLDRSQVSLVDWVFFVVLYWQLHSAIGPNSTDSKNVGNIYSHPKEDLSQTCKDTGDLVMFSIHVTFWVMIILLVNGCSVMIGLLFHKCRPPLDPTCIPVVSKFSKITAILCMLLTLFRCFANLFCTAKLPGIIFTGNRCETMYSTT